VGAEGGDLVEDEGPLAVVAARGDGADGALVLVAGGVGFTHRYVNHDLVIAGNPFLVRLRSSHGKKAAR
jgi:hypothetical protein